MATKVGMIGQIVLDTIYRYREGKVEDLGGLVYSIMAMCALVPPGGGIFPMTRVGRDAIGQVTEVLKSLPGVSLEGIVEDERPNNRVELTYLDAVNRRERVSGGVGPLGRDDLVRLEELDGLLINLVSGREMSPELLSGVRKEFAFPVHIDLHSYLIDYDGEGVHYWRRPDGWEGWLDFCDILQVNRQELVTIAGEDGEIFDLGEDIWRFGRGRGISCLLVTDGEWGSWGWYADEGGETRRCHVPSLPGVALADPTGSGDVYGAAFFYSRLIGDSVEMSMTRATRLAGFNCEWTGTSGLERFLKGKEGLRGHGKAVSEREGTVK